MGSEQLKPVRPRRQASVDATKPSPSNGIINTNIRT